MQCVEQAKLPFSMAGRNADLHRLIMDVFSGFVAKETVKRKCYGHLLREKAMMLTKWVRPCILCKEINENMNYLAA